MFARLLRAAIGTALACQLCGAFADTIKIAFLGALSGPPALQAEEILKNFSTAADLVNARGGVMGRSKIEVVPFDNKGNPQEALVVLRRVIDLGIHFVTSSRSNISLAISDALVKHNARDPDRRVLFLAYEAADPLLTESQCSFWTFRMNTHSDMQVTVLTNYMARQPSIHKVYLINQDYAYGQAVARAAKAMLTAKRPDIEIVGDDLVPLGKVKDFSPYVAKIRAAGADSVLTGNWGYDLSLLVKAGHETGLAVTYYTTFGGLPGTWVAAGAAGADRVVTLDPWTINAADSGWEKTLLQYKAKYAAVSNMDYLPTFRVVELLANAINKAGTTDPVRVAYALQGMNYTGPSGESWIRAEDHQLIAPVYILSLAKAGQPGVRHDVDGSGFGWKTEALIEAKDTVPPMKCQMERPPM